MRATTAPADLVARLAHPDRFGSVQIGDRTFADVLSHQLRFVVADHGAGASSVAAHTDTAQALLDGASGRAARESIIGYARLIDARRLEAGAVAGNGLRGIALAGDDLGYVANSLVSARVGTEAFLARVERGEPTESLLADVAGDAASLLGAPSNANAGAGWVNLDARLSTTLLTHWRGDVPPLTEGERQVLESAQAFIPAAEAQLARTDLDAITRTSIASDLATQREALITYDAGGLVDLVGVASHEGSHIEAPFGFTMPQRVEEAAAELDSTLPGSLRATADAFGIDLPDARLRRDGYPFVTGQLRSLVTHAGLDSRNPEDAIALRQLLRRYPADGIQGEHTLRERIAQAILTHEGRPSSDLGTVLGEVDAHLLQGVKRIPRPADVPLAAR